MPRDAYWSPDDPLDMTAEEAVNRNVIIDRFTILHVERGLIRPKERFILHWEDEGIIIPWLNGVTPKEAIIRWADKQ